MASFTKEVNPRLAKRPLVFNGRLANRGLTSLVKQATVWCQGHLHFNKTSSRRLYAGISLLWAFNQPYTQCEKIDNLPCPIPVKIGSVLLEVVFTMPARSMKFTRNCLTQWISKLLWSLEIHLVRQYLVNIIYLEKGTYKHIKYRKKIKSILYIGPVNIFPNTLLCIPIPIPYLYFK